MHACSLIGDNGDAAVHASMIYDHDQQKDTNDTNTDRRHVAWGKLLKGTLGNMYFPSHYQCAVQLLGKAHTTYIHLLLTLHTTATPVLSYACYSALPSRPTCILLCCRPRVCWEYREGLPGCSYTRAGPSVCALRAAQ